jgi:hypothetical protein|eukprot:jgi/Chrpa1/26142/Chrysochromulina_OHIO_Genome00010072-RA
MELRTMDGAALLSRLRERSDFMGGAVIPPDFWPETEEDCKLILSEAIVLLKTNNKSGYQHVYPVKSGSKPWQAKPYIRPKVQRSLGSFYTAEEAAVAVVHWSLGMLPTPPSPPGRNRRGEGPRPRDRRKKRAPAQDENLGPLCAKFVDEDGVEWYV